jgi:hypothetical protein
MNDQARAVARALCGVLLLGCASRAPGPYFGDERFLVIGVDPNAEVDELARKLEDSGFTIALTLRGQHFAALGATEPDGWPAKVRIVTARGIALALDPVVATPVQPGIRYALMPAPLADTHDPDGDGFEEVFVQRFVDRAAPCILVFRVRDSGFADRVPAGEYAHAQPPGPPPWDAPQFCDEAEAPPADAGSR